jgi:hypothetical protein
MIIADLSLLGEKNNRSSVQHSFNWNKADWVTYQVQLECHNWSDYYNSTDINVTLDLIQNSIWNACKASIPLKCHKTRFQRPLWENGDVRAAKKKRRETEKSYKIFKTETSRIARNRAANYLKQAIRNAVIAFERRIAENSNANTFWKYVRSKQRPHPVVGPLWNRHTNEYTDDPKECADLIAKSYSDIFTVESKNLPKSKPISSCSNASLTSMDFYPALLQRHLKRMRNLAAPGLDGIPYLLLKHGGLFLLQQLSKFFQYCLDNCVTPEQWKVASIVPIFKKGNRSSPSNYRPISLTSSMAKLMEACVREVIWNFWCSHGIINKSQFGFIPKSSCCDQLLSFLENISKIIDRGSCVDVIYFDFAKAFNTVPHKRLIHKLFSMGIDGNMLGWLQSFIQDRKEIVSILGHHSFPYNMPSGLPQGSVLGPLLFVAYINDIDANLNHATMYKYADDLKLFIEIKRDDPSSRLHMQSDIDKIHQWICDWQLHLAPEKCKIVHFGRNNPKFSYTLDSSPIQSSSGERDLGIFINHDLRWTNHISKITKKAEGVLASLNRAFVSRSPDIYMKLFKTMVRPHLEFASPVWNPHLIKNIDKLETVQRRATRRISTIKLLPYSDRLSVLNLDSLKLRRVIFDLVQVYKIVHRLSACQFNHFFKFNTTKTRGHSHKLYLQHSIHDFRKYFFSLRTLEIWNQLPSYIVNSKSVKKFKTLLFPEIRKLLSV